MNILVINSGSSSIKYKLFEMPAGRVLASGLVERIGEEESLLVHHVRDADGGTTEVREPGRVADHRRGLERIIEALSRVGEEGGRKISLHGVGHRVVHGGEDFQEPTLIDGQVLEGIRKNVPLAPLHNPANVTGIEVTLEVVPGVPQVAVFDTAFHQSIPPEAFHYAIPHELYTRYRVRRYGFHGTSHDYVARRTAALLGEPLERLNLITLHLGNGASAAAIAGGRSVDTSMGMTPLEGLIMGTRCGDLDPAIHFYLLRESELTPEALEGTLNRESGLKGICGANDMREVLERAGRGDERARLAVEMYAYRIRKYIGAYTAVLGRVDALVFTAGIGERSASIREACCRGLSGLGMVLDPDRNRAAAPPCEIQAADSRVRILVVPTDEEIRIAEQVYDLVRTLGEGGC